MIYTNVSGIPCQVKVTTFNKEVSYYGIAEYEVEFSVYDRRGYKAAWLERKMTDEDRSRIERERDNPVPSERIEKTGLLNTT